MKPKVSSEGRKKIGNYVKLIALNTKKINSDVTYISLFDHSVEEPETSIMGLVQLQVLNLDSTNTFSTMPSNKTKS